MSDLLFNTIMDLTLQKQRIDYRITTSFSKFSGMSDPIIVLMETNLYIRDVPIN